MQVFFPEQIGWAASEGQGVFLLLLESASDGQQFYGSSNAVLWIGSL